MISVGQRIKERREELGYSQGELANKMGVSRQAISKAELHDNNITTDKVRKFAKALDCTEAYLMGWSQADYVVNHNGQEFTIEVSKIVDAVDKSSPIIMNEETEKRLLSYADLFCKLNSDQQESIINLMKSMKK